MFRSSRSTTRTLQYHTHQKLFITQLDQGTFIAPHASLNAVFKPGSFGGQLMAQALSSASQSCNENYIATSQVSSFLAPVLLGKDVHYKVSTVRESGQTFITKRVAAFQSSTTDPNSQANDSLLFESTISFYKPSADPKSYATPAATLPDSDSISLENSLSLTELQQEIKNNPTASRRALYKFALKLNMALSESDMLMTVRVCDNNGNKKNTGNTNYLVGVDERLLESKAENSALSLAQKNNIEKVILPYVSDGMTQVLACADAMDEVFEGWPSKLTVWNYGIWFEENALAAIPKSKSIDGKRWFVVSYSISGVIGGICNGRVQIYSYENKNLLASSTFSALMLE